MRDYKYGDFYFDSQHDKQMKIEVPGIGITIDNSMIEQEAFEMNETLCSESELKFGRCEANSVKFTVHGMPRSIKGEKISISEEIDGNMDAPFPYGKYTVQSDIPTSDRTKREITAYDAMYDIINTDVKSWYAGLSFPMTLKAFRDSFFSHLGIAQKETALVNDGMTINKTLNTESSSESNVTEVESISGKTVIEAICEINGVFGNINRDGKFEYVELKPIINPLYPANDLYPADDLFPRDPNTVSMSGHYITFDYEDFQTKAITQLEIRPSDDSAGVKVGNSGNNYVISGNFLVSDKSGEELERIANNTLSVIKQVAYTPIKSCSCVGNPCLELGDPIRFNTSREIVESYVLQRTLTGIQSKRDSITSPGVEYYPVNNNSIKKRVESVENRTDSLEETADDIQEDVEEFKNDTKVRFETTENSIEAEVSRATGAESGLSSRISVTENDISTEVTDRQNADSNLSSQISQTASSFSIELSKKVSGNEVRSKFAMSPENVEVSSGKITFKAGTIELLGGNFEIDKNGNLYIVGSMTFSDGDYETKILDHDGRNRIYLQNLAIDFSSCTDYSSGNELSNLAFLDDIPDSVTYASKLKSTYDATLYTYFSRNGNFIPSNVSIWCGTKDNPFQGGYGKTGWNTTSDIRLKKDFVLLENDKRFENMFYMLKPISYRFIDGDEVAHIGFGAQPVKEAMDLCGIQENEFYGFHHDYSDGSDFDSAEQYQAFLERNQGNCDTYSLCYEEFIALNTHMIQKQHEEIESLKQENLALQNRLSILEQKMEELENVINNQNN